MPSLLTLDFLKNWGSGVKKERVRAGSALGACAQELGGCQEQTLRLRPAAQPPPSQPTKTRMGNSQLGICTTLERPLETDETGGRAVAGGGEEIFGAASTD